MANYVAQTPSVPSNWKGDERRFALETNDLMEEIFNQVSSLRTKISRTSGTSGITQETDPTVPDWAKQTTKPTYTASEVGALPADTQYQTPLVAGTDYLTPSTAAATYQPIGSYLTQHQDITGKADKTDLAGMRFGFSEDGSGGYYKVGSSELTPFGTGSGGA